MSASTSRLNDRGFCPSACGLPMLQLMISSNGSSSPSARVRVCVRGVRPWRAVRRRRSVMSNTTQHNNTWHLHHINHGIPCKCWIHVVRKIVTAKHPNQSVTPSRTNNRQKTRRRREKKKHREMKEVERRLEKNEECDKQLNPSRMCRQCPRLQVFPTQTINGSLIARTGS